MKQNSKVYVKKNSKQVKNVVGDYMKNMYAQNPEFKRKVDEENKRLDAAIAVHSLREELGLSQRDLAKLVNKPQSTIARIELGSTNVTMETLREIGEQVNKRLVIKYV